MFLRMFFSLFFLGAIFTVNAAGNVLHPLVHIPNSNDYVLILKNKDMVKVFMVNPIKNKTSDAGDVGYFIDDEVISVFFDNNKVPSRIYIIVKRAINRNTLKGNSYITFKYDVDTSKDLISVDRNNLLPLEDCFDGVDSETGEKFICEYKDAASVLHFLNTGK